jgi:uncharacterized protein YtpQ (UPF0354 family)
MKSRRRVNSTVRPLTRVISGMPMNDSQFTTGAIAYLKADLPDDGSPATMLPTEDMPVCRGYAAGLCICYLVDDGDSYSYVQNRHLDQDATSEEELHRIGLDNLADLANQRDLRVQPYQSIYAVLMGGDFEASLVLLDQLWEHDFRQFVSGQYAIAIPARDILAFCDASSSAGVAELRQLIGRIYSDGDHLISDRVYVRHANTWQPHAA